VVVKSSELDLGLKPRETIRVTWWGNATVAIESGDRAIVIDPYIHIPDDHYQYALCTHEHYDHAYPETISRLTKGSRFKKLILPRSCLYPSTRFYSRQLAFLEPDEYVILYPKYYETDKWIGRVSSGRTTASVPTSLEVFPGPNELWLDGWHIIGLEMVGEDPEIPFPISGPMPQLGYFVEDQRSSICFYHFGDNHWSYPEMASIAGRVDVMLLPIGKMGLEEDAKALDLMKPKVVIPIHWRYSDEDYPIPKLYDKEEPPDQQIRGHHFPYPGDPPLPGQPRDPFEYLESLTKLAASRNIRVEQVRAGISYELR